MLVRCPVHASECVKRVAAGVAFEHHHSCPEVPLGCVTAQVQVQVDEWVEDQVTRIEDNKCAPVSLTWLLHVPCTTCHVCSRPTHGLGSFLVGGQGKRQLAPCTCKQYRQPSHAPLGLIWELVFLLCMQHARVIVSLCTSALASSQHKMKRSLMALCTKT